MKKAFVTYLATDSFIMGAVTLAYTISIYSPETKLIMLVSEDVDFKNCKHFFAGQNIIFQAVKEISNHHILPQEVSRYKYTYTKLRIFEMYEYDKVVYIDADMVVCGDIRQLFQCAHMSAVNAGGLKIPEWIELNSGLLVVEPNRDVFEDMIAKITSLPSKDGSDQGFLQSYFPDWAFNSDLHLDHKFNVPAGFLDNYIQNNGFQFCYRNGVLDTNVSIVHFLGGEKPWNVNPQFLGNDSVYLQVIRYWWDMFTKSQQSNLHLPR